jgi:LacI family transcriptional regulator
MTQKKDKSVFTVQDIAREMGLSASSVSAVLSGQHEKRRISPETVDRVRAAAKRLRYVPNVMARSLRAKASGTKHVVLSILSSYEAPVFLVAPVLRALDSAIGKHGDEGVNYTVNIEMFHAGCLEQLSGLIDGHRCNGAIVTNTIDRDDQFLAAAKLPFPVVLLGRRIPGYAGVSVKLEMMGRQAVEILISAGRRNLAVLEPATLTQATRSRLAAFVTTAGQLTGAPPMMITCDNLQERAGYDAMRRFLALNPKCDGVFAVTDSLAFGAYLAIKRSGRAIPRDIAIVGVGDNPAAAFTDPPLTCFEVAEEAQNQTAARLLLDLVNGTPPESLTIEIPVSPVLRESTGHPGKECAQSIL